MKNIPGVSLKLQVNTDEKSFRYKLYTSLKNVSVIFLHTKEFYLITYYLFRKTNNKK